MEASVSVKPKKQFIEFDNIPAYRLEVLKQKNHAAFIWWMQYLILLSITKKNYINVSTDKMTWIKQLNEEYIVDEQPRIVGEDGFVGIYYSLISFLSSIRYIKKAVDYIYSDKCTNTDILEHPDYKLGYDYFIESIEIIVSMLKELIKAHKIISIHTNFQVNHVNLIDTISKNYINLTIHEKNMVDKIPIEELASKSDKSNLEIHLFMFKILKPNNFTGLVHHFNYFLAHLKVNSYIDRLKRNKPNSINIPIKFNYDNFYSLFSGSAKSYFQTIEFDNIESNIMFITLTKQEHLIKSWWFHMLYIVGIVKQNYSGLNPNKKTWVKEPSLSGTVLEKYTPENSIIYDVFSYLILYMSYIKYIKLDLDYIFSDECKDVYIKTHPNYKLGYSYFIGALVVVTSMVKDLVEAHSSIITEYQELFSNKCVLKQHFKSNSLRVNSINKTKMDSIPVEKRLEVKNKREIKLKSYILEMLTPCNFYNLICNFNSYDNGNKDIRYLNNLLKNVQNPEYIPIDIVENNLFHL